MDPKDLQKNSAEIVILALLDARPRHGYELAKLIESGSDARIQYQLASIYPILYRLEKQGLIAGKWIEKSGERRRRFYSLTPAGRKSLAAQRRNWLDFFTALNQLTGFNHGS